MTPPPADLGPHYDSVPALPPDEAERWVKLAHRELWAFWASWAVASLWVFVYLTLFFFAADEDVCTEASPCTWGWVELPLFTAAVAAVLLAPIAVVRFPVLGLVAGLLAALVEPLDPDLASYPSWVLVLLVAGIIGTCAVSVVRILGRREQRAIAGRHSVTAPGLALPQRRILHSGWILVVAVCAVVAIALTSYTAYRDYQWDQHANRAQEVRGTVTEHGSDDYLITVDVGDDQVTIDTLDAGMYPIGSDVTVLRDGDWSALAADPYDPTTVGILLGPLLLVAGLAAFGGLGVRRSLGRLRAPHPALRVDVEPDSIHLHAIRVRVWEREDVRHTVRIPVATIPTHRLGGTDQDPEDWDEAHTDALEEWELSDEATFDDGTDWDEEGWRTDYAAMIEWDPAVLHGQLSVGSAPTLVVFPKDGEPVLRLTTGLMSVSRNLPWGPQALRDMINGLDEEHPPTESWTPDVPEVVPSDVSADLSLRQAAIFEPASWYPAAAGSAYLALVAISAWVLADPAASVFGLVASTAIALAIGGGLFRSVTWRAQIDADGIVARVGLTKLKVSWDEIRAVPTDSPGTVLTRDREVAMLLPLPAPSARLFSKGESERLMHSIEAIHRDPSLRPTTVLPDPPPLIPELIVGLAAVPVAVNLAAWFLTR